MTGTRPVALGYVAARDTTEVERQRREVTAYASAEGLALVEILDDTRDGLTISQVTDAARKHGADAVVVPAEARLAEAYTRLAYELEQHGMRCVLLGDLHPATHSGHVLAGLGSRS
ncbi:recombinase family protein [Promicromonospora sp. NPDC050880]|uniref:recombinase family protein n=1 Tax=Promicromonospora sp. NPDC050880 TaxID=3364406 RepID=UPI00379618DC